MLYSIDKLPDDFINVVARIEELRLRLRFLLQQQPRRWTGVLRRSMFALAIQGSNSIEGYNVTVGDAVAAVDGDMPQMDERNEAWLAVRGYREAMTYVLQLADDPHFSYHAATLRSLHFMMLSYELGKNPGRWRPGVIFVRRAGSDGIVYQGPDAALVPGLVEELVLSLNSSSAPGLPVIVRAALAHLNLVMIHPYSDGNGRMARALQTLVLARDGILDATFSSIEEHIGKNTAEYYQVLADVGQGAWHPARDPLPWIRYCLVAHYQQAEAYSRRAQESGRLATELEAELKRHGLNERMAFALHDAANGLRVSNAIYRRMAAVNDAVASRDLSTLSTRGLLVATGEKRGRVYTASPALMKIREASRLPVTVTDPFTGTVQQAANSIGAE